MSLYTTIAALRELGVQIPEGLSEAELVSLGKVLNPWTVTVTNTDNVWSATTRKYDASCGSVSNSAAESVLGLLLRQLEAKFYTVQDTTYKKSAMLFRSTNPY